MIKTEADNKPGPFPAASRPTFETGAEAPTRNQEDPRIVQIRLEFHNRLQARAMDAGYSGISQGDLARMAQTITDKLMEAGPKEFQLFQNNPQAGSAALVDQIFQQFVDSKSEPERKAMQAQPAGQAAGSPAGAYDPKSMVDLDAFGRNHWARMTGAAGAGATAGGSSSAYGAMAAKEYDAAKGWASLTAENFNTSPFAKAGLDYATTMRLAAQGFSPSAIKATANLVNDLGIDMKKFAEPVAQLRRDVPGAEKAMRDNKHKSEDLVGLQEKLDKAKTDEERERLRKEMDRKRQELDEWRKQQAEHAEKAKPGSGEKLMGVFRATEAGLQEKAADKKMKDELHLIRTQPDSEAAKQAKARHEERAKTDPAFRQRMEGIQKGMKKESQIAAAATKKTVAVSAEADRQSGKNTATAAGNSTQRQALSDSSDWAAAAQKPAPEKKPVIAAQAPAMKKPAPAHSVS